MEDWVWWALSIYPVYVLPGALGRAGLVRRLWCGEASCMGAHSWLGANACVLDKILLNIKLVLRFFLSTLLEREMFFWLLKRNVKVPVEGKEKAEHQNRISLHQFSGTRWATETVFLLSAWAHAELQKAALPTSTIYAPNKICWL